jgi:hypothetical protein
MAFDGGKQNHPESDKPGSYKIASRVRETTINPGETLKIAQYITGYGKADAFKIQAYISDEIFDESSSYAWHSLSGKLRPDNKWDFTWGAEKSPVTGHAFRMMMGGVVINNERRTYMFDMTPGATHILTEEESGGKAPFEYELKTKRGARPGTHYISFYITYFDGYNWVCQEEKVSFKINNKFEQYSTILSALAAIALLVTIIHDGAWPVSEWAYNQVKSLINMCKI